MKARRFRFEERFILGSKKLARKRRERLGCLLNFSKGKDGTIDSLMFLRR